MAKTEVGTDLSELTIIVDEQKPDLSSQKAPKASLIFGKEGQELGDFKKPGALCWMGSNLLVVDIGNNRVQILDSQGKPTTMIQNKRFFGYFGNMLINPQGVATNSLGQIAVVEFLEDKEDNVHNHQVSVFDSTGTFVFSFGSYGIANGQFNCPTRICWVAEGNRWAVCDTENSRVQFFDKEGKFLSAFGKFGSQKGEFDHPQDICCNQKGQIAVCDYYNQRVQVFDESGNFLYYFGVRGSKDGQFNGPTGIDYDKTRGHWLVTDSWNNRIQAFDEKGTFIYGWGSKGTGDSHFDYPAACAISPDASHIAITDQNNHRICIYSMSS